MCKRECLCVQTNKSLFAFPHHYSLQNRLVLQSNAKSFISGSAHQRDKELSQNKQNFS